LLEVFTSSLKKDKNIEIVQKNFSEGK